MEHVIYQIARDMLEVEKLCPSLEARIARVVELVEKVHGNMGTLRSTQVLAHIISEWELQL